MPSQNTLYNKEWIDILRCLIISNREFINYEVYEVKCDQILLGKSDTEQAIEIMSFGAEAVNFSRIYSIERAFPFTKYEPEQWDEISHNLNSGISKIIFIQDESRQLPSYFDEISKFAIENNISLCNM